MRRDKRMRADGGQTSVAGGAAVAVFGLVVFIVGAVLVGGAWGSVPVDKVGLHYNGGPIEGESFKRIIQPGSGAQFLGLRDNLITLPIDQRSYTTCAAKNVDGDECDGPDVVAATRGGAEMRFRIGVSFKLNTGDDIVQRFYEQICRKYGCTGGKGWDKMLQVVFRGPIEQAIQQSVRGYTVDQLFAGVEEIGVDGGEDATAILERVQEVIATDLKENINQFVGGDYFCGPGFDRDKPDVCPDFQFQITDAVPIDDGVRAAFNENIASKQDVITAKNRADAEVASAEGTKRAQEALAGLYTDPSYVAYLQALAVGECAKNSNCTLIVGGGDAGVNVTPRQAVAP